MSATVIIMLYSIHTLENGYCRKILCVESACCWTRFGEEAHRPVHHLTWVHSEWAQKTDETITEARGGECRKNGRECMDIGVIIELVVDEPDGRRGIEEILTR